MKYYRSLIFISLWLIWAMCHLASAQDVAPAKITPADKCPVCGMFVAKYPDFVDQIVFKDGTHAFFDGVKDMMKYYFDLPKYNPGKTQADIAAILVTDYYTLKLSDGLKAWYVVGSDVYGPMGKELMPFKDEAAAKEFKVDHKGTAILSFQDITPALIKTLDQ
ncbi:MAG: nitrous oxide reductase accessory protein NosL [Deltaproteobacteria bacterium]|nr:nitrous oxide reductase accessory protein NosL [Deltaproteobacteria bacterium]